MYQKNIRFSSVNLNSQVKDGLLVNQTSKNSEITGQCLIQAIIIDDNKINNPLVLVSADIIWIDQYTSQKVRGLISKKYNIPKSNVCICASHTHGTYNIDRDFLFNNCSEEYRNHIEKKIIYLVDQTFNLSPINVDIFTSDIEVKGISINRRKTFFNFKKLKKTTQTMPNAKGSNDNNLNLIIFKNSDTQKIINIIARYSCHPVSNPDNCFGPDYPGELRNNIIKKFNHGINIMFLQGFCGDIRPNLIKRLRGLKDYVRYLLYGNIFRKSEKNDSRDIGIRLSNYVMDSLNDLKKINEDKKITTKETTIKVPLQNGKFAPRDLVITLWNINNLKIIFSSSEMFSEYSKYLKKKYSTLCVGYTNGMCGYIPTKTEISKGGYEVVKCSKKFGFNSIISENIESIIYSEIKKIL